jgi:DNA-binding transcriptional LysR family regulator
MRGTGRTAETPKSAAIDNISDVGWIGWSRMSVVDVTTRRLRYFVALAEKLNFTQTAAGLVMSQQALSRQIGELESAVGTPLFRRTSRRVELTAAGEVFLTRSRRMLHEIDRGVREAQRAAGITGTSLRLGFAALAALELTGPILREFRDRLPGVDLRMREYGFDDPSAGLSQGKSQVALIRTPVRAGGDLEFEPLLDEPLVVAVCATHPLASRGSVPVAELLDEPVTVGRSADQEWQSYWALDRYRSGRPAPGLVHCSSVTEEAELVAAGAAVAVTVAGAARYTPHPGIVFLPIADVPPNRLGVAWRRGARDPEVATFLQVAQEVRDRETAIVERIRCGLVRD